MFKTLVQIADFIKHFGFRKFLRIAQAHSFARPILRGYFVTNSILALIETNYFGNLKGSGLNVDSLPANDDLNKEALCSILEYLYCARILENRGRTYRLDARTARMIEDSKGAFLFSKAYSPLVNSLASLVLNKAESDHDLTRIDDKVVEASAITEQWVPYPLVIKMVSQYGFNRILDIGCGSCHLLVELCKQLENVSCVGIDSSEEAVSVARAIVATHGLQNKVSVIEADFADQKTLNLKGWSPDVITFMFVLHEILGGLKREDLAVMLKRLVTRFPDSYLLVCELARQSPDQLRRRQSLLAEHFFYHALSNQDVITVREWKQIFRDADLKIKEEIIFDFVGQVFFLLESNGS